MLKGSFQQTPSAQSCEFMQLEQQPLGFHSTKHEYLLCRNMITNVSMGCSYAASRPLTARKLQFSEVVTSPSMLGSPMSSDSSLADLIKSRAESPWNIQRPSTAISQDTIMLATQPPNLKLSFRPRPTTSAEHVARRRAYMIGPTEDPNYNEYMRNMSRYSALKGVAHGHVAQWGRSKSFIRATKPNKKW